MTVICGDFNSRTGNKTPTLDMEHPVRTSSDTVVCQRAPWLLELCETYQLYIINGIKSTAQYTCNTSRGSSVIDYIISNTNTITTHTDAHITSGLSDHALLSTHVPLFSFDQQQFDRLVDRRSCQQETTPPITTTRPPLQPTSQSHVPESKACQPEPPTSRDMSRQPAV